MSVTVFAAINVGSSELEMKIFEISPKNGICEIDRIAHTIELGKETYNNSKISFDSVDEMCSVLYDFSQIMKGYHVKAYRACATSAIREAINSISILDRIKVRTGLVVDVLSNSEQRFLSYKAFAIKEKNFDKIIEKGTILIDMGAGSAQVTLFDKGAMITTQNIRLGALRIRELLFKLAQNADKYQEILEEYIDNDLETLTKIFLKKHVIHNIIGTGENFSYVCLADKYNAQKSEYVTREEFNRTYEDFQQDSEEELAAQLNISKAHASLIVPSLMLFKKMLDFTEAKNLWTPNIKLCDGIAVDYAQKNKLVKVNHDFNADIISAARIISGRYLCNKEHTEFVETAALRIFDAMKKIHGLDKRERLILQIAAILHDCGKYVSLMYPAEAAYNIITTTEIIGLSHRERMMVAQIVKFNTMDFDYLDMGITESKLTAILRLANALDRSHRQKMPDLKIEVNDRELLILTNTYEDVTLEKGLFAEKAELFEDVYGMRPSIHVRIKNTK